MGFLAAKTTNILTGIFLYWVLVLLIQNPKIIKLVTWAACLFSICNKGLILTRIFKTENWGNPKYELILIKRCLRPSS